MLGSVRFGGTTRPHHADGDFRSGRQGLGVSACHSSGAVSHGAIVRPSAANASALARPIPDAHLS